jgi:hypothetical protein
MHVFSAFIRFSWVLLTVSSLTMFAASEVTGKPDQTMLVMDERFEYPEGLLHEVAAPVWRRAQGAPMIEARGKYAFIPGRAKSEAYIARSFTVTAPVGSTLLATFVLRVDTNDGATEPSSGVVFQFVSGDGRQRRARVAVRVKLDGSCNLGITAKSSNTMNWAAGEVSRFEDHTVRVAYDYATGCASLWVDTAEGDLPPAAQSADADAIIPSQVSLQQTGKVAAPDVRISELMVKTVPSVMPANKPDKAQPGEVAVVPAGLQITPPARNFYVFLLIGQSNMAGRGLVEDIDRNSNSRILAQQADGSWVLAREPLHWDKPRVAGVGPGMAFARELLDKMPKDASIGLIPAAFGGTRISWWQKNYSGEQHWPNGETYYQHALQAAKNVPAGSLAGVLWAQGESDISAASGDRGDAYRKDLHALIKDLRADLNQPKLPFVAATLGPWHGENANVINGIYLSLPREVKNTAVVSTIAADVVLLLHNKSDDPPHYDSASARLLGRHFADAIMPLLELSHR